MTNTGSSESYITVDSVSKTFMQRTGPLKVLEDVSFTVSKGQVVCIVGASGCGKSTLLRAVSGLDPDHSGTITVAGKKVLSPEKTRGIVFQEHRLFPWMTVEQNIGYALNGKPKTQRKALVQHYINLVRLNGFEKSYPSQLSGGMAQRAGIARALVNRPPVLLLDEPFGALDTFTKIAMQNELKRIQHERHTTMLMVTHDIDEAVFLSDKVIVLSNRPGRIQDTVDVDLSEPRDRNSIDFLKIKKRIYDEFFQDEHQGRHEHSEK